MAIYCISWRCLFLWLLSARSCRFQAETLTKNSTMSGFKTSDSESVPHTATLWTVPVTAGLCEWALKQKQGDQGLCHGCGFIWNCVHVVICRQKKKVWQQNGTGSVRASSGHVELSECSCILRRKPQQSEHLRLYKKKNHRLLQLKWYFPNEYCSNCLVEKKKSDLEVLSCSSSSRLLLIKPVHFHGLIPLKSITN